MIESFEPSRELLVVETLGRWEPLGGREAKWQCLSFDVYSNRTVTMMNNWIRCQTNEFHTHREEKVTVVLLVVEVGRHRYLESGASDGGSEKSYAPSTGTTTTTTSLKNWIDVTSRVTVNPLPPSSSTSRKTNTTKLNYKYQTFSIFFLFSFLSQTDWKKGRQRAKGVFFFFLLCLLDF